MNLEAIRESSVKKRSPRGKPLRAIAHDELKNEQRVADVGGANWLIFCGVFACSAGTSNFCAYHRTPSCVGGRNICGLDGMVDCPFAAAHLSVRLSIPARDLP